MIPALLRRPAIRALAPWYSAEEARSLVDRAIEGARRERPALPRQPGAGGVLMVRLASLTRWLYEAMIADGATPLEARDRTAAATWAVYRHMGRVPGVLSRLATLFSREPTARLRAATSLFRSFPFGPPSYEMEDVEADERTVAFDVVHCPVAAYFRAANLGELCVASFCDLDHRLAPTWGATLDRTTTLAQGHPRCDFRWRVAPTAGSAR